MPPWAETWSAVMRSSGRSCASSTLATISRPSSCCRVSRGSGRQRCGLAAIGQARQRGFRVLSCRPSAAEAQLSYASLADLLADIDDDLLKFLPDPQRRAIDFVLLRGPAEPAVTDYRATGAALLSVLDRLADDMPVMLAIDDLQWMDSSTAQVVDFALRRLSSPVVGPWGAAESRRQRPGAAPPAVRPGPYPSDPGGTADPGGPASDAPHPDRLVVPPAHADADRADLGRQPVLRPRTRPGHTAGRHGGSVVPVAADAGPAGPDPDRRNPPGGAAGAARGGRAGRAHGRTSPARPGHRAGRGRAPARGGRGLRRDRAGRPPGPVHSSPAGHRRVYGRVAGSSGAACIAGSPG